jgi:DNA-directed RNA polymerase subunit RPC12/RpoP
MEGFSDLIRNQALLSSACEQQQPVKMEVTPSAPEKRYRCTTCGQGFSRAEHLKRHQTRRENHISCRSAVLTRSRHRSKAVLLYFLFERFLAKVRLAKLRGSAALMISGTDCKLIIAIVNDVVIEMYRIQFQKVVDLMLV